MTIFSNLYNRLVNWRRPKPPPGMEERLSWLLQPYLRTLEDILMWKDKSISLGFLIFANIILWILYSYNVRILGIVFGLLLSAVILDAIATALGERKASSGAIGSKRGAASNASTSQTAPQLREAVERLDGAVKSVGAHLTNLRNTNHAQFCALVCGGITSLWLAMWLGGGVLWHGLLSGLLLMPLVMRGHAESDGEVDEFLPELSSVLLKELNAVLEHAPDTEEHSSMLLDLSLPPDAVLKYASGEASSSEDEGDGKGPPTPEPPSTDTTDSDSEFLIKDKRKKSNPNEKQNPGGGGYYSASSHSPSAPPQLDSDSDEFEIVNKDDL